MKIFRYKASFCEEERIISIGIKTEKIDNFVDYSFAHTILSPEDEYNDIVEKGKLQKRMFNTEQSQYDFELPIEFFSRGATKSFAFSYCVRIINDWCNLRGIECDIKISDYKITE